MGAPRRWQAPDTVVLAATRTTPSTVADARRLSDLAGRMPLGPTTMLALLAAGYYPDEIIDWASKVYQQHSTLDSKITDVVLTAAGFDQDEIAYGVLDPQFDDGERVCAVIRASAGARYEAWGSDGWESVDREPAGLPYLELTGAILADALEAVGAGGSLVLRPLYPIAFLSARHDPVLVAAADLAPPASGSRPASPTGLPPAGPDAGGVYAITDPLDTTAVVTLFRAMPGPKLFIRRAGAWTNDDGTLLSQLRSISPPPVVTVPPDQVAAVLRQVDDFDTVHPRSAAHPTGGGAVRGHNSSIAAAAQATDPKVCGLCVRAADTGRVLLLQRANDPSDPNAGTWEFPGGHADDGEDPTACAQREWQEETGQALPGGPVTPDAPSWDSPNGIYRGFVHEVPTEADVDLTGRDGVINPDDPDGDQIEAIAWWDPTTLKGNPVVRHELSNTMHLVQTALDPVLASAHDELVADLRNKDSEFDADRIAQDQAEAERRLQFERAIKGRHAALVSDGMDPGDAGAAVQREIQAEDARRECWERDRADALAAERQRRLQQHATVRESALDDPTDDEALAADAAPHTAMPHQLLDYWTRGKGAAKIRWGESGDFDRAVRYLLKYMDPYRAKAAANELHKIATGIWPSTHAKLDRAAEGRK